MAVESERFLPGVTRPSGNWLARGNSDQSRWQQIGFWLVWMLAFSIPWGDMVLLPLDIQASRVLSIATFLTWSISLWQGKRMRSLASAHWFMLLFVLWAAASAWWNADSERSLRRTLSYCQLFLDAWLIYQCAGTADRYRRLLQSYVLGCYVCFAGLMWNYLGGVSQGDGRYTAPGFDPNDLSVTLVLGIPIAWHLAFSGRSWAWVNRLFIPCAIVASLLTASRSGLVTLAVGMVFPLLAMPRISTKAVASLALLASASGAVVITFWSDISIRRLSTIQEQLTARDLNGRVDIWSRGFEVFKEHPVAGVGAGGFGAAVGARRSRDLAAHNALLGVLVEHGLVGLGLFVAIVVALLFSGRKSNSLEARLWVVQLAAWGVALMTLSWENREVTWLLWGLCSALPAANRRRISWPVRQPAFPNQVRHA